MKKIKIDILKQYNKQIQNDKNIDTEIAEQISYFLRATSVRIDSDIMGSRKRKEIKFYEMNYSKIKEAVIELQRKFQERKIFNNSDIANFIELNRYADIKNMQVKIMGTASIVLLIIAILFEYLRH